ncbi:hypothetical protein [Streptomyces abikoensis]|uniref:hypothetical protein n=1 Tax=Streptomyces abikoensis TaxID=97398 RepID=UPI001676CB32|nr:hypothetical protein [Streptomyces abikoensis]
MLHKTYFAYGIRIPDTDTGQLENLLAQQDPDSVVGFLHAGDYDRNMTFLVTECREVKVGAYETVTPQPVAGEQCAAWNRQLLSAAAALGITDPSAPSWLVVPDLS